RQLRLAGERHRASQAAPELSGDAPGGAREPPDRRGIPPDARIWRNGLPLEVERGAGRAARDPSGLTRAARAPLRAGEPRTGPGPRRAHAPRGRGDGAAPERPIER